ncbi:HAD family hydrolase [Vallitalea okinawensis]|uniref:HAD family hydrolase n=1 Tax=Vallitalea okinawensis TaxID=2078660 RepID=UPI000CFE32BB|nr:HAD family hydrolase [Vallitalea okinawensis]
MSDLKYILFDCMETIIDMDPLPKQEDYAGWGYVDSGYEKRFGSFNYFYGAYRQSKEKFAEQLKEYEEYDSLNSYLYAVGKCLPCLDVLETEKIAGEMYRNFWKKYSSFCYISSKKKELIRRLSDRYTLGIISNFKVPDGIEELLERCEVKQYFTHVTTSILSGYRKPHHKIYEDALKATGLPIEQILYIGDDEICDYQGAREFGFDAYLYNEESIKMLEDLLK